MSDPLAINPTLSIGTQLELALRLTGGLVLGAVTASSASFSDSRRAFGPMASWHSGRALFAIISGYGYTGPSADPTRIKAQIVSGIGFPWSSCRCSTASSRSRGGATTSHRRATTSRRSTPRTRRRATRGT